MKAPPHPAAPLPTRQNERRRQAMVVESAPVSPAPSVAEAKAELLQAFGPMGGVAALNAALAAARGPVVARMDADDVSLPARLERQLALLEAGVAEVVGCQVRYFPEEIVGGGARRYEAWLNSLITPEEHARDLFI